ncbi:MAG: hypothetical protein QCI00_04035 [Candidatus Thermoplasmatota archaeon]|nr:hypothetical protein [Candidatus Thermoplasmatota archaeon]
MRITFNRPKKSHVLIIDEVGSAFLSEHVLNEIDHTILPIRGEKYFFNPKIIIRFLLIYLKKLFHRIILRKDLWDLGPLRAYALACIYYINPKIVLTFIDNNPVFYWLSDKYTSATFFAIQNGSRVMNKKMDYSSRDLDRLLLQFIKEDGKKIHYISFGTLESSFYKKYGANIKKYYPVGSVKGSHYRYNIIQKSPHIKYTLCLISQYRKNIMNGSSYPEFKNSLQILESFVLKFIQETGVSLCIALASEEQEEFNYFANKFGKQATIIKNKKELFTTYEIMSKSEVILSFNSTAAIEAFGWGKKILLCNYSKDPIWGYTFCDICTTNTINYNHFKNKLQSLLDMNSELYVTTTKEDQKYMMNYNPKIPVPQFLRDTILETLKELDFNYDKNQNKN